MNKIFLASVIIFLSLIGNAHSSDKKQFYVKGDLGLSIPTSLANNDDYAHKRPKNALLIGLGAGYEINNYLSFDGTFYHFGNHKFNHTINGVLRTQNIKANAVFLDCNLDIYHFSSFSPFISLGGGVSHNDASDYIAVDNTKIYGKVIDQFAWNIGAGIKNKLSDQFSLALSYKYFDLGNIETMSQGVILPGVQVEDFGVVKSRFKTQSVMLGIKYNF
jgi:opacity protein-like surface antigen